jgi:chorismate synthase
MNTFGHLFRVTTFGESHGPAMGAVVDGCPAGVALTRDVVQQALDRRRPGQSALTTARNEPDQVELLSGVFEDKTLGTPIAAIVRNQDQRSQDYEALKTKERPGHADRVWRERFKHRDPRGGGRTSGRETLCRVIGGAVADAVLAREVPSLRVLAWVSQVERFVAPLPAAGLTRAQVDAHASRVPDEATAKPVGLGEPVFGKLKARLAEALAGIGAVTGVVWGPADLEERLKLPGTAFHAPAPDGRPSEVYGGIQGGLTNGEPVLARVLFKPTATLTDVAKAGRHDPCILPRAVPVVEAMAAMVLADLWLSFLAGPHRP